MRLNFIVNEENNNKWFAITTEEIVKAQMFFDSFINEFKELKRTTKDILMKEKAILNFDQLDESTYAQWKSNFSMEIEQL